MNICVCVYMYLCIYIFIFVCTYIYIYIYTYINIYVYVYICMYRYTYKYTYVYIHIKYKYCKIIHTVESSFLLPLCGWPFLKRQKKCMNETVIQRLDFVQDVINYCMLDCPNKSTYVSLVRLRIWRH